MLTPLLVLLACAGGPAADTAPDTDTDVEGDTDTDADTDSDTDTDADTDTDVDPDWAHCPDASVYVGDTTWPGQLLTDGATYCTVPSEERSLEQELAAKAQLHIPDGTWPVPTAEGLHDLALPVCTRFPAGPDASPAFTPAGTTAVSPNTYGSTTYTYLVGEQRLLLPTDTGDDAWRLAHTLVLVGPAGETPAPLTLDGGEPDLSTGAAGAFTLFPDGGSAYDATAMTFGPCAEPDWTRHMHTVAFDGGDITLELWMGLNLIETAPSAFLRATGTLDGTPFDVTDGFRLVYRPDHHHYGRDFAVIFDAPVGDACALRVEAIDGQEGTTTAVVTTAGCDLTAIEARNVTAESWVEG